MLVGSLNAVSLNAAHLRPLPVARPLLAVTVVADAEQQDGHHARPGAATTCAVELHTLHSPYRELTDPVLSFLDELDAAEPDDVVTVIIPEFVVQHWYSNVLHNQSALALKARLLYRPNTVVVSVPTLIAADGHVEGAELDRPTRCSRTSSGGTRAAPIGSPRMTCEYHSRSRSCHSPDQIER